MVSSIGSYNAYSTTAASRPDPAQLVSKLFSKLDTKGQGFIEQADLQSAFSQVFANASSSSTSSSGASDSSALFKALDGDGNGKLTESEFSSGIQKLAEALDSQAFGSRVNGGQQAGGMRPPRGGGDGDDDAGFTKDQLTSQLQEIGSTDSKRASLISNIVNNFDKADSDGDGKVSRAEAMAFDQSTKSASSTSTTSASSSTGSASTASQNDAALMHRIMELMRAYGSQDSTTAASQAVSLSVSA